MLQPHSLLWHYLWLGPHILQAAFAIILLWRGVHRQFPFFLTYLVFEAAEEIALYTMDVAHLGSARTWWLAFNAGSIVEGILKLGVIGELFFHLLHPRPMLAKWGRRLISSLGASLVLLATAIAAYTGKGHSQYALISGSHILLQSLYIVDGGLVLFLFLFAAYYKLSWSSRDFGVALGFGIVFCEHMAALAIIASGTLVAWLYLLDFLNMATYHVCVLIWFYFLLVPHEVTTTSAVSLPENNLDIWNRELERLLQQ
jgi:hypothetical protein